MRATRTVPALLLAALVTVTGCTGPAAPGTPAAPGEAATPAGPPYRSYVALGDSFTAGPYVPTTDLANGCLRSDGNYPSIVARRLKVASFTDVSCSGAKTRDLQRPQHTFGAATVPPQLDAVKPDTDLVTIGIGGNDLNLFSTLVNRCPALRPLDPAGSPCTEALTREGFDLASIRRTITDRVTRAVEAVRAKAPEATVLLVGYLRLTPTVGTCPRRLPFATGDYPEGVEVGRALNGALADAARNSGVGFVDMHAASRGHDICADRPWVNGATTDQAAALHYHPFPAGMRATADAVLRVVRSERGYSDGGF